MSQDIYVATEHLRGKVADISFVMLACARELAQSSGGEVIALLLGHNAQDLSKNMAADRVFYYDDPVLKDFTSDAYQKLLAGLIREEEPRAVLFGSTSIGADVASVLSARLQLPIVGLCRGLNDDGKFVCQIYGGKMMVEGTFPGPTTLISMIPGGYKPEEGQSDEAPVVTTMPVPDLPDLRVKLISYREPDESDVDVSKEPILIAVGRGVQTEDNIELVEEFAELIGGVVCASRPVIDQGWLPTTRLIGKSGKTVNPKLYLAMGISGAPEHVEGITGSELIVAVNTDPDAPIFDVATYGIEADMLDLTDALIEQVEEIKGV
jgi:electron transfer flavoprotein alpha subunit